MLRIYGRRVLLLGVMLVVSLLGLWFMTLSSSGSMGAAPAGMSVTDYRSISRASFDPSSILDKIYVEVRTEALQDKVMAILYVFSSFV